MAKIVCNDFEIAYQKWTHAGQENVFFIHGNLASKEWWYPTLERLKPTGQQGTLIAADWRGYGESKGLTDIHEINFLTFAKDFICLIENENLQDVHLVGHSTGGLIAMLAILEKPELFKSLTLLDSVGATGLELELPKEQVLAHFKKMSEDKDYSQMVLAATIKGCDPSSSSFQQLFNITWNCDKVMFTGVIDVLSDQIDITEKMSQIQLPTLILHGDEDAVLPLKMSESIHQLLPQSTLKVMDGQGHSMNLENPQRMADELLAFWHKKTPRA